ncbi:DUF7486 family protein [Flagellimonas meridianipacifica]|uniref:DUF7486 domain-containing protein n=1 Tax=Flagellimonas meridianipacifica TaxID=1080225 RepID=A0A2T0MBK7_9FLAO|nr:hypothetical protein [Allomuricauda pacifica]PRX54888.1 hypothetical protein CLV81_3293 [Allomuricauda pacifica]
MERVLTTLKHIGLLVFFFFLTCVQAQVSTEENIIYWHIKAVFPEAQLLDIKAIDKDGTYYDVKAIQDSHDISLLSVKALVNGQTLPIKMIISENDTYYPVKAIDYEGRILDVKAIGKNGEVFNVKGVSRMGNLIEVRAIDKEQKQHDVISISPNHGVNHVKGLKMFSEDVEAVIHGVKIFAHVKSLEQY